MSSSAIQISAPPSGPRPIEPSSVPDLTLDIVRCSRCQQSLSLASHSTASGVVQFGMNSYYCHRCASKVGFLR
ncbi:Uncharacterized protein PECH_003577 [Penicillium ucsense]|uniref:Uncharacterized protein n=2 Tax=Penicillium TaxID=5073 RepID=A0A8J8W1F5_9EURO|nr:uncharacterized protein N7539_005762 [Penicillium diatomitis]KAF7714621.1 Uncharacterized protein PECM_007994 [Penicillium ucsense]KAF7729387.1 Uncharacterized protein PECH_003577 [Penicillium ucsense]KAJ5483966.1 hypothetical protein N7539_005762 [Penicillium diatomitis]